MTTQEEDRLSGLAAELARSGRYKILRHLPDGGFPPDGDFAALGSREGPSSCEGSSLDTSETAVVPDDETMIGCIVDVETTGLDAAQHSIIELAMRRFRYDARGHILALDRPYTWLQDPGIPLDPKIVALTGLRDEDLAGQSIDEDLASALLPSADVVIAHNASFDRPFVERRLPAAAGRAWACSCHEVDWPARGFDGRALGWLLAQCGWFHGAHRAGADVEALLAILTHRFAGGTTVLADLMATASTAGWLVRAVGASYEVKDLLKARGYRWDSAEGVWWREIADEQLAGEQVWLHAHVYAPWNRPKTIGPDLRTVTWHERHARRGLSAPTNRPIDRTGDPELPTMPEASV